MILSSSAKAQIAKNVTFLCLRNTRAGNVHPWTTLGGPFFAIPPSCADVLNPHPLGLQRKANTHPNSAYLHKNTSALHVNAQYYC